MANNAICDLLESYPISFALASIVVDGYQQPVTSFTTIDHDRSLAYFNFGGTTVVADCNKISLIEI
ncbi:hypothetical protein SLU01_07840 [Sporosarcina luteola]|uniref:Uncharacterized protein n=1 Tax=Sporosarcina luteola TaxID=582850 RepID=A0A511Z4X1_9BACL|nr:hypothetical protein [Sporosarcina luteola]GEN82472.1 hypothetical protein SLU01_07840 [Sporosarcina luteola]